MAEIPRESSDFPSLYEYLDWAITKPSNNEPELRIALLRDYPSRFGLTGGQMRIFLKLMQSFEMLFEKRGLIGGGMGQEGKNLGSTLDRGHYGNFGGLLHIGFDEIATGQRGQTETTLGKIYPVVNDVAHRAREQLMSDSQLQARFPGIGEGITLPVRPANPDAPVTLVRSLFDPRPFMEASRQAQLQNSSKAGGVDTVEILERLTRMAPKSKP